MIFTLIQQLWICPSWQNRSIQKPARSPMGVSVGFHDIAFLSSVLLLSSSLLLRSASGCSKSLRVISLCACVSAGVCICVLLKLSWRLQWRQTPSDSGTCSVGLLHQMRLISADKGEIRRFKIEKVVCGRCTNRLKSTVGKQTGGRGREGEEKQRDREEWN